MIVGNALRAMFSSGRETWATPTQLIRALSTEFTFTLDACAAKDTAVCPLFFSEQENALSQEWVGCVWMNPPYGNQIEKWVHKAWDEGQRGATVVCLLPSRTDTRWWHRYCMQAREIRFLRGRLRFDDQKNAAPFPSVIVIFGPTVS